MRLRKVTATAGYSHVLRTFSPGSEPEVAKSRETYPPIALTNIKMVLHLLLLLLSFLLFRLLQVVLVRLLLDSATDDAPRDDAHRRDPTKTPPSCHQLSGESKEGLGCGLHHLVRGHSSGPLIAAAHWRTRKQPSLQDPTYSEPARQDSRDSHRSELPRFWALTIDELWALLPKFVFLPPFPPWFEPGWLASRGFVCLFVLALSRTAKGSIL